MELTWETVLTTSGDGDASAPWRSCRPCERWLHRVLHAGMFLVTGCVAVLHDRRVGRHGQRMYRVVKPGAKHACSEYLLTPFLDWESEEHLGAVEE